MTYRDDSPLPPSCPFCGLNDLVSRDTYGQKHQRHAYLCGRCWAVFSGSQDEWRHHWHTREMFKKRQENLGRDQRLAQGMCYWCGVNRSGGEDHLTPRSRGGTDDPSNLVLCCHSCNSRKGTKTADEYRAWLEEQSAAHS